MSTDFVWDMHADVNNADMITGMNYMGVPFDHAVSAFLEDLRDRGLEDKVLLVCCGEMGRTPRINKLAGRDHWPQCYSVVLAGGGIHGGQVVGKSDSQGAYPAARAVSPADIHATVFAALGYDSQRIHYMSSDGRPMPLSEGKPIEELLG